MHAFTALLQFQDLPRIMKEAFYLARTGRPGPVLVDVPKDIQQQLAVPDWSMPMAISGYMSRLPQPPKEHQLKRVVEALHGVCCATHASHIPPMHYLLSLLVHIGQTCCAPIDQLLLVTVAFGRHTNC